MRVLILQGSPRPNGNTNQLVNIFCQQMEAHGNECKRITLYGMDIRPCRACRFCQQNWTDFNCCQQDDVSQIFSEVLACDLLILASPIYSWYCTPPMKAVLDRLVYGMNKYYGDEKGPALWTGKLVALITTCGYAPNRGADLWEEGIKRYCKHSQLNYCGMLAERHLGYKTVFMDDEKARRAASFADTMCDMFDVDVKM